MILEIISVLVVVSIIIVGYRFTTGIWPGSRVIVQEPPEASPKVSDKNANFMFFYTEWCPYSKNAEDPWKSFKQMLQNNPKTYGGKTITFEEIDAEAEIGRAALYKVVEYPTFKLQTSDKVYQMLGKPSVATFRAFLISSLGKESS
jgi:hypothetical protein